MNFLPCSQISTMSKTDLFNNDSITLTFEEVDVHSAREILEELNQLSIKLENTALSCLGDYVVNDNESTAALLKAIFVNMTLAKIAYMFSSHCLSCVKENELPLIEDPICLTLNANYDIFIGLCEVLFGQIEINDMDFYVIWQDKAILKHAISQVVISIKAGLGSVLSVYREQIRSESSLFSTAEEYILDCCPSLKKIASLTKVSSLVEDHTPVIVVLGDNLIN